MENKIVRPRSLKPGPFSTRPNHRHCARAGTVLPINAPAGEGFWTDGALYELHGAAFDHPGLCCLPDWVDPPLAAPALDDNGRLCFFGITVFFNVWFIAKMMFVNSHDLLLATVLLIFASAIAMSLSFFFSTALTERIQAFSQAAQHIAAGSCPRASPIPGGMRWPVWQSR